MRIYADSKYNIGAEDCKVTANDPFKMASAFYVHLIRLTSIKQELKVRET